jgi:ADP-glucose pyrophosphorylase
VPLGANYRLIDIPVSNCINSNVNKIYCLTQFNSASLNRHLSQAYVSPNFHPFQSFVEMKCGRAAKHSGHGNSYRFQIHFHGVCMF